MTSTIKTITNLSSPARNWVTIPGTNIVYGIFTNDTSKLYYFDATTSSPITATSYTVSGMTNAYNLCYGYYNSTNTIFICDLGSGYIFQVSVNGSGLPVSSTQLANSNSVSGKTHIAFNNNNLLYVLSTSASNQLQTYSLSTNTYTTISTSGSNFLGIINFIYYANSLYVTNDGADVFKGVISGSSVSYSVYLSGYVDVGYLSPHTATDTMYLTDYVSGGTSSVLYKITNFTSSPSQSVVDVSPSSVINGFWALSLSSDYSNAYINSYDTPSQLITVPLSSPPPIVPCFTCECEILTPDGYVRVDRLKEGQLITTPDNRHLPIIEIFSSEIVATEETAPYRIPANFFGHIPYRDVILSPHHAFINLEEWTLPVWTDGLKQETGHIGKPLRYYHIRLEKYAFDKLVCSGLTVDSWEGEKEIIY